MFVHSISNYSPTRVSIMAGSLSLSAPEESRSSGRPLKSGPNLPAAAQNAPPPASTFAARYVAPQVRTLAGDGAALRKPAPQSGANEWKEF